MSREDIVSVLLIVLAVFDWIATAVLVVNALRLKEAALEERATVSVVLSTIATAVAVLAGARLTGNYVPDDLAFFMLAGGLALVSLPQLIWVVAFWAGRFR